MLLQITATSISGAVTRFEQIDVWRVYFNERRRLARVWVWEGPIR